MTNISKYTDKKFIVDRDDKWLINNLCKISFILGFMATTINILFYDNKDISGWIFFFIVLFLCCLINEIVFKRFASYMVLDFNANEATFVLYRKKGTVIVKFNDIKEIRINYYVVFMLDGRNIYINEVTNKQLVPLLEKIRPVSWTRIGKFLYRHW